MDTLYPHADNGNIPEKRCSVCKKSFPATSEFFSHRKSSKDGLYYQCKSCKYQLDAEYRKRPESEERRKAYASTPEYKERNRAHHRTPGARASMRKYQSRPEIRHRATVWNKTRYHSPELGEHMHLQHRVYNHRRRARIKATSETYTVQQIQDKLKRQKYACYYCSSKLEKRNNTYIFHIDHVIPLSRGGSNDVSNLVLTCPTCNLRKNKKLPHEWPDGGRLL